jgi:hypothetical protein
LDIGALGQYFSVACEGTLSFLSPALDDCPWYPPVVSLTEQVI